MTLKENEFKKFLSQCEVLETIDFPDVCARLGLDWFRVVKPSIINDPGYNEKFHEYLEGLKYRMLQQMYSIARLGKRPGRSPDISFLKAVIEQIDRGSFIGSKNIETTDTEVEDAMRLVMGLTGEEATLEEN